MTSFNGDPIITIHNCPMLQEVKLADTEFGPWIEYIMKNIFLEKSHTKCGGETLL